MLNVDSKINTPLSVKNILSRYSPLQIYKYYIGGHVTPSRSIISPLRPEKRPSFSLYGDNESLKWKDWALGKTGGVIDFVMELYKIDFKNALMKINDDFQIGLISPWIKDKNVPLQIKEIPKYEKVEKEKKVVNVIVNKNKNGITYLKSDIEYWKQRQLIDIRKSLIKHRTYSIKEYFSDNKLIGRYTNDSPIYGYLYEYNNEYYWKIYRPYAKEYELKFYSNLRGVSDKCIHGLWYLPERGENLIITKSAKDCIIIDDLGFNVVGIQSESTVHPISIEILNDLQKRFNNIYLLYDNDWDKKENWGQKTANGIVKEYPFINNIRIPTKYQVSDTDEFILKYRRRKTIRLLNKLIYGN
jgi:hypothetical protein